ncbi:MAG: type IV secretion system DNA-binding domain-containing protein [Candidatus Pacebacteria bacterium]|nr:type IV secretion system DNA-binding domain-containing protein [Candidatus Paceibacterota bacterium]
MTKDEEINFFGLTTFRNQKKKFGIKPDDRRRHIYVVGKTGMGKTEMLANMAIQDIQAGRGICFVDPHGEVAEKLLDFVPSKRVNDVVYFNPADIDYPIAFNVMEKVDPEHRHLVAAGLMGVFKKIWPDVWSARMEYILNNSVLALLEYPGSTLLGVNRMLADPDYRKKVVERVNDPVVKSFWVQEFARYTQRYETEATAAIQNKIGQFISNPLIRNIIGQVQSTVNMRKIMDEGKILIANISKGRIGEDNSRLLGALVITKIQLAAMSRVDILEEKRKDFYLYVDEFQNFATDAFINILSEARKYRLNLTLANQYLGQLEEMTAAGKSEKVRDAVFGNVGTIICFRVGAEDAEFLEKEFMPEFLATDLVNLGKYNIYLKLMIDGIAGMPFSAITLPPFPKSQTINTEKIIKVSRERYGTPKKIIEEKIIKWVGAAESQEAPQRPAAPASASSVLYDAKCAACGKWTKVIFPPDGKRPVYCKSCLNKVKNKDNQTSSAPQNPPQQNESFVQTPPMPQTPPSALSLDEAVKEATIPFSPSKKNIDIKEKPKRKEVNLEELKKVLEESLKKNDENTKGS